MRVRLILAAVVGLALVTAIVAGIGLHVVGRAIEALGWSGFALFCLSTAPMVILLGGAWAAVAQGMAAHRLHLLVWTRMVRDAAAEVLPFSQIGGIAIGARAVVSAGVPEDLAVGSTLADLILEVVGQFFYTLIGLTVLVVRLHPMLAAPILWPAIGGLALLFVVAAGSMVGYRRAWAWIARQVRQRLPDSLGRVEAVGAALDAIFQNRWRLALGAALHLSAWIASAVSAWVALLLMGVDVDLSTVIALESLMYALRNLGFALPGGLGVQEGAYVILGPLFGIPPANVLALSLIKRGRDIALGVPVLLIWQAREGRGLIRARRERARRSAGV